MADAFLKIVIDALNNTRGELGGVKKELDGVGEAGKQGGKDLGELGGAFEQLTGVSLTGAGALMAVGAGLKYSID